MSSAVTDLHISRRSAVTAAAAAAALLPLVPGPAAHAGSGPAFLHGIASGDPLPDGILDPYHARPRRRARFGLGPVIDWESRGPVGRTRTTPAHDAAADGVRFGVVSCANWEAGWFSPYRHLAARTHELLSHLTDHAIGNTIFLTGDIHMAWANDVPVKAATYPLSRSAATEFVVTSVTSDNLDDLLHVAPQTVSLAAAAAIRAANRHVKWVDMDSHGYGVLDVTPQRAQMDYYTVSDRTDRNATTAWARSYRTQAGSQRVERATHPCADAPVHPTVHGLGRFTGSEVRQEAERHPPGGLGGLLVVVRQLGVGEDVAGPGVAEDLHIGAGPPHPQIPGIEPVVWLERVGVGHMELHRQLIDRGVVADIRSAVQQKQSARLVVGQRQVLRQGAAERETGVDQPAVRVRRGGGDGPFQQLVAADPLLDHHAVLDGFGGLPLVQVRHDHLMPGRAQSVGRLLYGGPQPVRGVEQNNRRGIGHRCHFPFRGSPPPIVPAPV
ncbi:hypothetical protein SANTM175S_02834 [Streptomyces antimycoticus]